MKKLLFILAAVFFNILAASAQTAQVATLSHDGAITTFYSANALKDAYAAAVDGDVITLSAGTFSAPAGITKNITVRGAGMMPDGTPTILLGDIMVQTRGSETAYLTLEGFYHTGKTSIHNSKDVKVIKCWLRELNLDATQGTPNTNVVVINCRIQRLISYSYTSISFINDVVTDCYSLSFVSGSFINCLLEGTYVTSFVNSSLKNCVILYSGTSTGSSFGNSTTASHCYFVGAATNPFRYSPSTTNVVNNSLAAEDIFKDMVTYELKDEYAGSWLGDDGTQAGAHGGFLPFDPTPTNPQITKFNVSSKTTADGMLSVDIEVKANN